MSDGRTIWWPKDSGWWRREYVVVLGEEFGAAGPAVLDWLSCEAKLQNDGGRVKAGIRTVARGAFVEPVTVGHVLSRAVALGALDDLDEADGKFTCRLSGWDSDNRRGSAAMRKARSRAETALAVTPGHGESRSVLPGHEREENRREEKTPPNPPKGGMAGNGDRELQALLAEVREVLNEIPGDKVQLTALNDVQLDRAICLYPNVDPLEAANAAVARGRQNLARPDAFLRELRALETRAQAATERDRVLHSVPDTAASVARTEQRIREAAE